MSVGGRVPPARGAGAQRPGADPGGAVVRAAGLTKRYGDLVAVDAVDFEVRPGRFVGLLGPNGAGKSTLMKMLYGVAPPTSGRLELFGLDAGRDGRAIKARLGVVPQEDNLDEELSVRDNLLVYARYHGLPRSLARERADELLEFADLGAKARSSVRALSGGMKRRLTLARGLMNAPDLVVLDEPTTGLDPQVRQALWDKLERLRSGGTTLLMSTHYMDEAERLCDELLIMDGGRIIAAGEPRALVRERLPAQAVEARVPRGAGEGLERLAERLGGELERAGERATLFVPDAPAALRALRDEGLDPERAFVRPTNLEDLFLRLAGRSLRE